MTTSFASPEALQAALADVRQSPIDGGILRMIVRRPAVGEREIVSTARLLVSEGVEGDTWNQRSSKRTTDGGPHPDMQLNLINWRAVCALADTDDRRALAGDQLYVDLALGYETLPWGTRLAIGAERGGTAMIEVTDQPHTGCAQFTQRFGLDAHRWVNSDDGRALNLRGINARVVAEGMVNAGDLLTRVKP